MKISDPRDIKNIEGVKAYAKNLKTDKVFG